MTKVPKATKRKTYKRSKYNNKKILVNGVKFDSMKEYKRYLQLQMLERAGEITDLQRQVKYVLIPAQKEPDTIGPKGGIHKGKTIEQECAYIADFVYKVPIKEEKLFSNKEGHLESMEMLCGYETIVEDTKGVRTPEYVIKRKLMLYIHGIRIKEV